MSIGKQWHIIHFKYACAEYICMCVCVCVCVCVVWCVCIQYSRRFDASIGSAWFYSQSHSRMFAEVLWSCHFSYMGVLKYLISHNRERPMHRSSTVCKLNKSKTDLNKEVDGFCCERVVKGDRPFHWRPHHSSYYYFHIMDYFGQKGPFIYYQFMS